MLILRNAVVSSKPLQLGVVETVGLDLRSEPLLPLTVSEVCSFDVQLRALIETLGASHTQCTVLG